MRYLCYNGTQIDVSAPVLSAANRSYRYGNGFFETLKVFKGIVILKEYHEKRIENSLRLLNYSYPGETTIHTIFEQIYKLCDINNCIDAARIRLSFSAGEGNLYETNSTFNYLIEAWPLDVRNNLLNEEGLILGFFEDMKKHADAYALLKSASALIYSLAARQARENNWDDAIVLNHKGNICETSIANIFWIKDSSIFTPPLSEGCINGVIRAYLSDTIKTIVETPCTIRTLQQADEVFLTNAIRGIQWVKRIENTIYSNKRSEEIFNTFIAPLYNK